MVGSALFLILGLAGGFAEAAMLSFGFSAGAALAVLIVGEIRRRSSMEAVPRCLRGGPLVLVTMGLLSLVCISAAMVFYAVLGAN
jgi:Na+-translocating ferredoxin:NAD+ oxidoreductase RnfA subunit